MIKRRSLLTREDVRYFLLSTINRKLIGACELRKRLNMSFFFYEKYIKMGMPWSGKPTKRMFEVSEVIQWLHDHEIKEYSYIVGG